MALEDKMDALTKALDRNSSALEAILAKGPPKADAGTGAAAGATAGAAGTTSTKAAGKGSTKAPKAPTEEDLRNAFGGYLSVKDKAERETRKANVTAIIEHFGVSKATEIPQENWAEAIGYVKTFEKGETPNFMNEEGAGDEGNGESLI